jgi:hypothetical protein
MVTNYHDYYNRDKRNRGRQSFYTENSKYKKNLSDRAKEITTEDIKKKLKEEYGRWFKKLAVGAAALATWYVLTTPSPKDMSPTSQNYILPKEIKVTETSLPTHQRVNSKGTIDYYINTEDITKNEKFSIKTDRYTVEKDKDYALTRAIGHAMTLMPKAFFWDWDIGRGVDTSKTKAFIAMLEQDTAIKDITVRLGYNAAWKDFNRLFTDEKVKERNGFLARVAIGLPTTIFYEIWAELGRGDYYNAITQTAVIYSNVESIGAHEIGHHKDFQRYDRDWIYQLLRPIPPVTLFQEGKASFYAKDMMSDKDAWQFNRYLIPAFAAYVWYTFNKTRKQFRKKKKKEE